MVKQVLIDALTRLLRPLVRITLRQGLSAEAFEEVVRRVYVDVAEKDFALAGKKQTTSRIGVLTGLNRKEVARLKKMPLANGDEQPSSQNRVERVLSAWLSDTVFQDEKGDPRPLDFQGEGSFSELVRRYSGDMPARAVADELIRIGVLAESDDRKLRLLSRGYVPDPESQELVSILGTHAEDWFNTFDHNMTHGREDARYQRQVIYTDVPARHAEDFRSLSARWGQRTLEELDRWLAEKKATRDADEPTVRLGLGIYEIETWSSEDSERSELRDGD
jgi:hypothetical protein